MKILFLGRPGTDVEQIFEKIVEDGGHENCLLCSSPADVYTIAKAFPNQACFIVYVKAKSEKNRLSACEQLGLNASADDDAYKQFEQNSMHSEQLNLVAELPFETSYDLRHTENLRQQIATVENRMYKMKSIVSDLVRNGNLRSPAHGIITVVLEDESEKDLPEEVFINGIFQNNDGLNSIMRVWLSLPETGV